MNILIETKNTEEFPVDIKVEIPIKEMIQAKIEIFKIKAEHPEFVKEMADMKASVKEISNEFIPGVKSAILEILKQVDTMDHSKHLRKLAEQKVAEIQEENTKLKNRVKDLESNLD